MAWNVASPTLALLFVATVVVCEDVCTDSRSCSAAEEAKVDVQAVIQQKLAFSDPPTGDMMIAPHCICVKDAAKTKAFYAILGAKITLDYGVFVKMKLGNNWLVIVQTAPDDKSTTPDKPGVLLGLNKDPMKVSAFLNVRVADIQAAYKEWEPKGVKFITPPMERPTEWRCYMRDPDDYLIELGQTKPDPSNVFASMKSGVLLSRYQTIKDYKSSRDFYLKIGGKMMLDLEQYSFGMVDLHNSWVLLGPGGTGDGGATDDKPGVMLQTPEEGDPNYFDTFMIIRTTDVMKKYEEYKAKGVQFLTEPKQLDVEKRCYMRDPAGYIIELGQNNAGVV